MCLLAAPYGVVLEAARTLTGRLSPAEREAIFGRTAEEVYRLAGPWPIAEDSRTGGPIPTVDQPRLA